MEKTHWLQSPNKNYLGHWDLPEGKDLVLTIKSAQWEKVKNPLLGTEEAKRVIRFVEKAKPLICNQTNANSILKSTGIKYMEDSEGQKIALYVDTIRDRRTKEDIDCVRVRNTMVKIEKPAFPIKRSDALAKAVLIYAEKKSFATIEKHYKLTESDKETIKKGVAEIS
jgi:hypothetical protein